MTTETLSEKMTKLNESLSINTTDITHLTQQLFLVSDEEFNNFISVTKDMGMTSADNSTAEAIQNLTARANTAEQFISILHDGHVKQEGDIRQVTSDALAVFKPIILNMNKLLMAIREIGVLKFALPTCDLSKFNPDGYFTTDGALECACPTEYQSFYDKEDFSFMGCLTKSLGCSYSDSINDQEVSLQLGVCVVE
jgi:hypothetical protein